MDRRADVVDEPRQRQLGRAQAAAELLLGLANLDLQAGPGQRDRRRQPVRAGADDHRPPHRAIQAAGPHGPPRTYHKHKEAEMQTRFRVLTVVLLAAAIVVPAARGDGGPSPGISLDRTGITDPARGLAYS